MLGLWECLLNKVPMNTGDEKMNLESMLSSIKVKSNDFQLNPEYVTIRYITHEEYKKEVYEYIEPNFLKSNTNGKSNPKFILFSAPGATGKSALARHICYKKNGIYWDLPDNKVAEYSFDGAMSRAVGFEHISNFVKSIENEDNFFVIDAFDEAEAGSGRTGIEYFLRDLNNVTKNCTNTCAILLARTESAIFIKNYLIKNEILFKHYEVGLFAEDNAKTYLKSKLKKLEVPMSSVVDNCINEQFNEINRIFPDNESHNFLGYAPVLDALAKSYDNDRNTLNLLKNTVSGENNCTLMSKILRDLLKREHDKFIKALIIKIQNLNNNILDALYDSNEQLNRLFGMLLLSDSTVFEDIDETIPKEYYEEYLEIVNIQLPQHPFVQPREGATSVNYDFTGAAFKDFVIAYSLADELLCDFVDEYFATDCKYCPSQMLIEFYGLHFENKIKGKHIPLMYNSFKARAQLGDEISVYINGDIDECFVEFNLTRNNKVISLMEFNLIDLSEGIWFEQLSNCYIDIQGVVHIGSLTGEARICNSIINCEEIIWNSENVTVEAYTPGECVIVANKFNFITNTMPRFEIRVDDKKNLKISSSTLKTYFKLLAYKCDNVFELNDNDFISFSNLIRRIFSCLRSHSKDTPARKRDFVDNRIIGGNSIKKDVLNFLIKEQIIYSDSQDWLYKLDTNKLSKFAINWNAVRNGELDSLINLHKTYMEAKNQEIKRPSN